MDTKLVTNKDGNVFAAKLVPAGGRYGRNDCLVADEPMVEFYDAEYAGKAGFDAEGQFVSRYYISTLEKDAPRLGRYGLCLDGGIPKWQISAENAYEVLKWLRSR